MLAGTETWSTWEELLLGGAVLRHGTNDWDAVAAELRSRTTFPYAFTPPVCKAKYKDLQQRYSGCKAWFEELRKRRVAELKQALEQSDDSIGCLKTKLETLKSTKGEYIDHDSNQTESPVPFQKLEGSESFGKEASKDGLSAGSFTQETRSHWSPRSHPPAAVSSEETDAKPGVSESSEREKVSESSQREKASDSSKQAQASSIVTLCGRQMKGMRKRRGKRKRKDCNILGPVTEVATESRCKESSALDSCHIARASSSINEDRSLGFIRGVDDLVSIFDSVAENQSAHTFRHRLNSQKRARYKKLIRRHLDFEAIRTAISNQSITTVRELFRDLLLLANNASIFYSKRSREHKAAKLLRDLVTKSMRRHCGANDKPHKAAASTAAAPIFPTLPLGVNRPVKPRSTRPCKHRNLPGKVANADDNIAAGASQGDRKPSINFPPPPPPPAKKGSGHQGRSRRGSGRLLATAAKRGKGRGRP